MKKEIRPMNHELEYIWITGDGKRFFDEQEAQEHQKKLEEEVCE